MRAPTFLQRARVVGRLPPDDVEDAQQLQHVLHAAGAVSAARLGLRRLPAAAQDVAAAAAAAVAVAGQRAGTQAAATAHAVLAQVLDARATW